MLIHFLCLCSQRLSIKLNFYIECGLSFKSISYVWTKLQINNSWFGRKFKAENRELESSILTMCPRLLNILNDRDATPALKIGKLLTGPFFK